MAPCPESVFVRRRNFWQSTPRSFVARRSLSRSESPPGERSPHAFSRAAVAIWGLLVSSLLVGCATVQGEKYTYQTLPRQYVAAVRENPQTIDLTRLASSTASSDVLDKGDVVELTIAAGLNEKDTVKMPLRIQEDGCADIPEIGRVQLAGQEITAAEATVVSEFIGRGLYRNPNITLVMKTKQMNRIMVAGAVKKPSIYELPRGQCDLLAALSKAEGLDESAGTQVIIRNSGSFANKRPDAVAGRTEGGIEHVGHSVEMTGTGKDTVKIDLISATKNGTGGYQLQDGAVVYVEKRDPEPLHVMGVVAKAGRFDFPIAEELRVTDAIAMAGGVTSLGADKIFVIRRKPVDPNHEIDPNNPDQVQTFIIQLSLANAKQVAEANIRLAPGDVVSVEPTPLTFLADRVVKTGFNFGGVIPIY